MSILNLEGPSSSRSGKSLKVILGIGALAAVVAVASTLAANININSGPVEFGQGVAQTTTCDDQITVTPYSTFINDSSTGSHMLTSIKVGGIDSSEDKCAGKTFVIKAYGDSGLLPLFNWEIDDYDPVINPDREWRETERYNFVEVRNDVDEFTWTSGGTDHDDVFSETSDISDTSFTLNLVSQAYEVRRNPLALATAVKRITVETRDTIAVDPVALCEELGGVINQQTCEVDSSAVVYNSITIPTGFILALTGEIVISINSSVKVTNNGRVNIGQNVYINNAGYIVNNGTIYSFGVMNNYRTIDNDGLFFNNSPTGTINNELGATFINDGQVLSNHQINNNGFFNNNSSRSDAVYLGDDGVVMNFCPYEWAGPVPTGTGQYLNSCT